MKNIYSLLFVILSINLNAQNFVDFTISGGVSNLIKIRYSPFTHDQDNGSRKPIPLLLIDISRSDQFKKLKIHYGARLVGGVGTKHDAYGHWAGIFAGLKIGIIKPFEKVEYGININPTLRLYGQQVIQGYGRALNGDLTPVYNFEINPNVGFPIWNNKLNLVIDYSIGLTPLYNMWSNFYFAHYFSIGMKYQI